MWWALIFEQGLSTHVFSHYLIITPLALMPTPAETLPGWLFALRPEGDIDLPLWVTPVTHTLSYIWRAFWRPNMTEDVRKFIRAWALCARAKTPNQPAPGEPQPLHASRHPWSSLVAHHLWFHYRPDSEGKDNILTIINRFSKALHLVTFSVLLSAKTTAELILEHVVHLHGFPKDLSWIEGNQFIAKFCGAPSSAGIPTSDVWSPRTRGWCTVGPTIWSTGTRPSRLFGFTDHATLG